MRETIDTSYSTINSLHPTDPMQNDASKSILYEAHGRSWFYVLYLVTISELFVCDVVLLLKFVVSKFLTFHFLYLLINFYTC